MADSVCAQLQQPLVIALKLFWSHIVSVVHALGQHSVPPLSQLTAIWQHPDPLLACLLVLSVAVVACWLWSTATRNCSHVDRLWSILPIVYVTLLSRDDLAVMSPWLGRALGAAPAPPPEILRELGVCPVDLRILTALCLVVLWGARLTFNFARKGGYNVRFEDYRWAEVRKLFPHPALFQVFSLVFVALAQNVLILAITLPAYLAWLRRSARVPLGVADALAGGLFLLALLGEVVADQQQWLFHAEKLKRQQQGSTITATFGRHPADYDCARGFLTRGLWAWSRHPNFFCELACWWSFYLLSAGATGCGLNWTLGGVVGLTLMFHFSTNFTEGLTSEKYSNYKQYQKTTSRLLPWFPARTPRPAAHASSANVAPLPTAAPQAEAEAAAPALTSASAVKAEEPEVKKEL